MTLVRAFEPDDLPAVWALGHLPDAGITADPGMPVPLPPRRTAPTGPPEMVDPQGSVLAVGGVALVAERDGTIVGFGGLRPVHDRPRLGRLVRIRVHPAVRRVGVGRELMSGLEAAARRQGLTDLLLDVGDHQPEALAFYRALGWSETWRESGPEWHWQTVWFHRSLERDHLPVEVRPDSEADERVLQAWDGDRVVGQVVLRAHTRHDDVAAALGPIAEVEGLSVVDDVRRRGVGTALLGAAAGLAQEGGASTLGLAVDHDDPVVTLCRRLGWVIRPSVRPRVDGDRQSYWVLDLPGWRVRSAGTP